MTDLVVSDAVRFAQDEGIGSIQNGAETWHSAGNVGTLAAIAGTGGAYVHAGLEFRNHDSTNVTVTLTAGAAFVLVEGVMVQSSTDHTDDYDTTLPHDVPVSLVVPSDLTLDLDSGANNVYLAYATDDTVTNPSPGDVYCRYGSSVTEPAHPSVHIGAVDAANPSADTRASDSPDSQFADLTASTFTSGETHFVPEPEPATPTSGCVRWYDETENAYKVKFDDGATVTIAER